MGNLDEVIDCIKACWRSIENYTQNGGIGYCLLTHDAIASWCSTDYVIGNECDLYAETFEGHRRRGLGTLVASACLQECLDRGLAVFWHCFGQNTASVRLAELLGPARIAECAVYVVDLADHAG